MQISCRHCGEPYDIEVEHLPRFGASVRCPACGGLFELPARSAERSSRPASKWEGSVPGVVLPLPPAGGNGLAARENGPSASAREAEADSSAVLPPESGASFAEPPDAEEFAPVEEPAPAGEAASVEEFVPAEVPATSGGTPDAKGFAAVESGEPSLDPCRLAAQRIATAFAELHGWRIEPAIEKGRLLVALGTEITAAWDLYRREVGEDAAREGRHFQDEFNEKLFGGRTIL